MHARKGASAQVPGWAELSLFWARNAFGSGSWNGPKRDGILFLWFCSFSSHNNNKMINFKFKKRHFAPLAIGLSGALYVNSLCGDFVYDDRRSEEHTSEL